MTVMVAGMATVVVLLSIAAVVIAASMLASTRARSAADSAALAGAQELVTGSATSACSAAERLARANHATLDDCRVDGDEVAVTTSVRPSVGSGLAVARSRAGPAPAAPTETLSVGGTK